MQLHVGSSLGRHIGQSHYDQRGLSSGHSAESQTCWENVLKIKMKFGDRTIAASELFFSHEANFSSSQCDYYDGHEK